MTGGVQMHQTPDFSCKPSQHHLHSRISGCTPWSQCRHLYATCSSRLARLAWKVIHFIPRDKWSHRLLAPFRRQTESCVKEIHFGTFNKRGAGGQLMYVISSVSWLRSLSDSHATLSWSERMCRPHHVVKICGLLRITYSFPSIAFRDVERITLLLSLQNGNLYLVSFSVDVCLELEFTV